MPLTSQQQAVKRKVIDYGNESNSSTINAGSGNDIVFSEGGNDTLNGEGPAMPPLWALRRKLRSSPPE